MSKGTINKVFIVGNVGQEPVIHRNDKCQFVQISLATMTQWRDKATNEKKEKTEWHQIIIYGKLVDIVENFVHKGDKICIIGHLQTRKWANADGKECERVEIIGEEMQLLSPKERQPSNEVTW